MATNGGISDRKWARVKSGARITMLTGAKMGAALALDQPVVVGRSTDADLTVDAKGISRQHLRISPSPTGTLLEDLDSKNGVLINGLQTTRHDLVDGDLIKIGSAALLFSWSEPNAFARFKLAAFDDLSGTHSRPFFDEKLKSDVAMSARHRLPLCVGLFGIDQMMFRGHERDDFGSSKPDIIKTVATLIRQHTKPEMTLARYRDAQFALLFPVTGLEAARAAAEKIRVDVKKRLFVVDRLPVEVTLSVGIANIAGAFDSDLVAIAAACLYKAAELGGNCVLIGGTATDASTTLTQEEIMVPDVFPRNPN